MLHKERDVFKAVHAPYIYSRYCAFVEFLCWRPSVPVSPLISCHKLTWCVFCFHLCDFFCVGVLHALKPGPALSNIKYISSIQVVDAVLLPIPV